MEDAWMTDRLGYDGLVKRVHQLERELQELKDEKARIESEVNTAKALYGFVASLGMSPSLSESLQLISDKIREFFCSDGSCLALFEENSDGLSICACSGKETEGLLGRRFYANSFSSDEFGKTRIFLTNTENDPIATQITRSMDIVAGMTSPIRMGSHCFGFAYVFSQNELFTDTCLESFPLLTNHAAAEIQRSKTEQLLRESEERFRFMAETTGDVIYRLKYDTMTYDYLSPGIFKLTGYTPKEIEDFGFGKLILRIDKPTEKDVSTESIIRNRRDGKTEEYRADYLLRIKSGELRWVRDHSFPWYDESAAIVGSVGILSDVSDYKRAEARIEQRTDELIESEERYRTLVENVPLVVYRMRPGAEVFFLNQFVEQVFGFSASEILRSPELWEERLHREDRSRVTNLRNISLREAREFIAEYRIVHKDGHLVHVLDHAVPLRSYDGRISSLDGIIMDMTGRVRLQEQLVEAEGLKTISEVSQRLAHEIRNPLVSAGGFARLLLSSMAINDPHREKVEIIVREVARLESILQATINYLQPLELKLSQNNIADLVRAVLWKLAEAIADKRISTTLRLAHQIPPVPVDPLLMEKALEALIRNAVHHMPDNAGISVSSSQEDDFVKLLIEYQAEHVSNDDIAHFFYPFTTSHFSPGDPDLPMSKIIITKHGGQVHVSSPESNAITLTVLLPVNSNSI